MLSHDIGFRFALKTHGRRYARLEVELDELVGDGLLLEAIGLHTH